MRPSMTRLTLALLVTAAAAHAQAADSTEAAEDARQPRRWAVSGEIGLNSLASLIGPVFTFWAKPAFAVDLGAGLSSSGLRPGVRARYLFTARDKTSFFGGVGFKTGLGSNGQEFKVEDPETKADLRLITNVTYFADAQLGTEFLAGNGFLVIGNVGYSVLLSADPYEVASGSPSKKATKALDAAFGSGPMLSVSLGKAF